MIDNQPKMINDLHIACHCLAKLKEVESLEKELCQTKEAVERLQENITSLTLREAKAIRNLEGWVFNFYKLIKIIMHEPAEEFLCSHSQWGYSAGSDEPPFFFIMVS